jgi:sarcosine oxidase subunit alpha
MVDPECVPAEGCQVVDQGRPVGRVTSTRFSPTLGRTVGLGWLPAGVAVEGRRFFIRVGVADVPAVVAPLPFYDPDGRRLRS